MKDNNRIELHDSFMNIAVKMCGGNPGAMTVILRLFKEEPYIDPDSALPGINTILSLDDMGIYNEQIWMIYKDVCKEDIVDLIGLFRARQLGYIPGHSLLASIDNPSLINVKELVNKVKQRLPNFGKNQGTTL
ncbi:MAG: hypothetical protein WC346_05880 [Methanogenium sp.]|jgi:hypothetical protein